MTVLLHAHLMALRLALRRLLDAPLATLAAMLAIGVALALPAAGQMLLDNAARLLGTSHAQPQISLFMKLDVPRTDSLSLASRLRSEGGLESVEIVTREQTLARMREQTGFAEVLDALEQNPFPDTLILTPLDTDPAAMEALAARLRPAPGIETVQLDSAWVRRLDALIGTGRILMQALAGLFGLGLVAVTFGTIRLQVMAHAAEIEVSRLLGATDGFIRRPFHYLGLLQGLLGGMTGWLIVLLLSGLLRDPLGDLARQYGIGFVLAGPGPRDTLVLLVLASALGWIGAALSVGQHLRRAS